MIKVEVVKEFTFNDFYKIKGTLTRKSREKEGYLYVGDIFECEEPMMKYLTGDNKYKTAFVKVIEKIPEAIIKEIDKVAKETNVKAEFLQEAEPSLKVTKRSKKKKK